jgi:3-oxoacyl-[acyl-carrier-protein] synthase-3
VNQDYTVGILAAAHKLPDIVQTNEELCETLKSVTSDWILQKTGIKRRYIALPTDSASSLATDASLKLLEKTGVKPEQIGLIIVASYSPDYIFPPMSVKVQNNLRAKNAQIIDINTCCTGVVTGMTIANDRMQSDSSIEYAIVIGVELQTRYINPLDQETSIYFSDGAGVILLGKVPKGKGYINSVFFTDSSTYESVRFRGGGSSYPYTNRIFDPKIDYIEMNGLATWKQAITNLPIVIRRVCEKSRINLCDIDFCIFHQANYNLIEYVMAKLKIQKEKTYINVCEIGNTGSASIAIALSEALEQNCIKKDDLLLLAGVGAGFNFGVSLWRMQK